MYSCLRVYMKSLEDSGYKCICLNFETFGISEPEPRVNAAGVATLSLVFSL